jgi:hypothetical protein
MSPLLVSLTGPSSTLVPTISRRPRGSSTLPRCPFMAQRGVGPPTQHPTLTGLRRQTSNRIPSDVWELRDMLGWVGYSG